MPSQNRITVNLPSKSLYSALKKLALKTELTLSGLVQKIVIASLRSDATDTLFLEGLRADTNPDEMEIQKRNLTRILHHTLPMMKEGDTSDKLFRLSAKSIALPDYPYAPPDIKFTSHTQAGSLGTNVSDELKKLVRESLKEYVIHMTPRITGQLGGEPDILHLFVKKAIVQYYHDDNGLLQFKIRPELHVLPLFINDAMNSRLDLLQVKFKQFKDVAVKGWDKMKYDQLVLINNASTSRSGGYFVGVSLCKLDYISDEYKNFHCINIKNDTRQKPINCMVHIHHGDVKFKKILKPFAL